MICACTFIDLFACFLCYMVFGNKRQQQSAHKQRLMYGVFHAANIYIYLRHTQNTRPHTHIYTHTHADSHTLTRQRQKKLRCVLCTLACVSKIYAKCLGLHTHTHTHTGTHTQFHSHSHAHTFYKLLRTLNTNVNLSEFSRPLMRRTKAVCKQRACTAQ